MPRAFVTGSHAYGEPGNTSDVDLVILVTKPDLKILLDASDEGFATDGQYGVECPETACLRFGDLNILACTSMKAFEVWQDGTRMLKEKAPVSRDTACRLFDVLRRRANGQSEDEIQKAQDRFHPNPRKQWGSKQRREDDIPF